MGGPGFTSPPDEAVGHALVDLACRVRESGLRITRQRSVILRALCELGDHASAEQVHRQAQQHLACLDLSTVYRNLERLRDLQILSQTDLGRGCLEFEVVTDRPHHHLICQACGRVTDLEHSYLAGIARTIREDLGFEPVFAHFAIFGLCEDCRYAQVPAAAVHVGHDEAHGSSSTRVDAGRKEGGQNKTHTTARQWDGETIATSDRHASARQLLDWSIGRGGRKTLKLKEAPCTFQMGS